MHEACGLGLMKYIAKCMLRVSSRRPVVGSSSLSSMIIESAEREPRRAPGEYVHAVLTDICDISACGNIVSSMATNGVRPTNIEVLLLLLMLNITRNIYTYSQ